jgi:sensor domain CHASE-containing protein
MAFRRLSWRSLKTRVTLFTLAIFVLSIWAMSGYVSTMLRADMERMLGEQLHSNVSVIGRGLNDELKDKVAALEAVASGLDARLHAQPAALQAHIGQLPILQLLFNLKPAVHLL